MRVVYLLQGALAFAVSAPIQVGMFERGAVGQLAWLGVALWAAGMAFEVIGDWQLGAFRADQSHRGQVMSQGLWRYTRHPNYFGDACVWWGIFFVVADRWPGPLTVVSPVLMTVLLTAGSGARVLDRYLEGRPGWAEYAARTSRFIPLPPRRGRR